MAWFVRGAQSAFFYYVSCAPCHNARFNKIRAKEKARVDKATKKALALDASGYANGHTQDGEKLRGDDERLLAGVGAFTTNINWRDEIELGPNFKKGMRPRQDIERNRANTRKAKRRRLHPSGRQSMQENGRDPTASLDTLRTEEANNDAQRGLSTASGNLPSRRHQQRADEALWGNPHPEKDWSFYARGRNPSINSLTPPVVSTLPASSEEASWMLQPPPPAKVMEGKQAPMVQRSSSIGAASKVSVMSKISKRSGGSRLSELRRPEKVMLADLGENICSQSLPAPLPRKGGTFRRSRVDGATGDDRPTTPEAGHLRQDSAFSNFDSPSRNIARFNRPPPIQTFASGDAEAGRDAYGFDHSWVFPRRALPQGLESPPEPLSTMSSNPDGMYYHSEPEPDLAYSHGISYQDFAHRQPSHVRSPTADSEAPYQTPKSKATTRAGSNSPSPRTLSPNSSSSSLHELKDAIVPPMVLATTKHDEDVVTALPSMEGITEEEMQSYEPRYTSGPRQVRLGSGTHV